MDYKEKRVNRIILIIFGLVFLFGVSQLIWNIWEKDRLKNCIESCFYKETEVWCGMGCWSLFDKYNVNISNYKLPTECEVWGGEFPFLCKGD